jgi:hypothetical protein
MKADPAELEVVRQQFARFGSVCRRYAPLYRQVSLAGLRTAIAGGGGGAALSNGPQYNDVRDSWRYYLEHDNRGRGVVLIGHSQGSFILAELIRQEIDGKPISHAWSRRILLGATQSVPQGKDVGGSFQHLPLCRKPSQVNCLVTYVSFRSTSPPPSNTRFGKVTEPGMVAACTNPARSAVAAPRWSHTSQPKDAPSSVRTDPAVGCSRASDRNTLGERARPGDSAVRIQRARVVSRNHGARRSSGSAHRQYPWRSDGR